MAKEKRIPLLGFFLFAALITKKLHDIFEFVIFNSKRRKHREMSEVLQKWRIYHEKPTKEIH